MRYGGKPKLVLDLALEGKLHLLVSTPLKLELERVLRDKFSYTSHQLARTAAILWRSAETILPRCRLDLCPEEPDNRVLECALEGRAAFIVTGDRHLLNLPPIDGLTILTPDAFLTLFRATGQNH
jgi:putative PIN family toxin of toxin-antitoxin system